MSRYVHTFYVGLGSNLGDRQGNILGALQALRRYAVVERGSALYETAAVDVDGPAFLNAVARVQTDRSPAEFERDLEAVEARLGRGRRGDRRARPIDLDLLVLDEGLNDKPYYLAALAEIAPELTVSTGGVERGITELAAALGAAAPRPRARSPHFHADRQAGAPEITLAVDHVGVARVKRSLKLVVDGAERTLAAELTMSADLARDRAGVHMSRFSERLEGATLDVLERADGTRRIDEMLATLAREIRLSQHALAAEVTLHAPFTLERWTPVSARRGEETYRLIAAAAASEAGVRYAVGVEVEGMTACPCAQLMMREQGKRELLEAGFTDTQAERALDALPAATHNQRGRGRLQLGIPAGFEEAVRLEDLVEVVEQSMSSETYELLKRPDEFFVVNKAHHNPRFVEDVVRGIVGRALELYTDLPDDTVIEASQVNDESIHKHDAVARAYGTFGELRAELAGARASSRRTDLITWLQRST